MSDCSSAMGSEFEFWKVAQATVGGKVSLRSRRTGGKGGRTGKVPLAPLQPYELAKAPCDTCRERRDEDETNRDNVEFGEFFGSEGEGDFVEEKAGGEEGGVDYA
jgi:hypothetical protein